MPEHNDSDKFLRSVAEYYAGDRALDQGRLCLVFPNKRAVIFFRQYYKRMRHDVTFMPRMLTIGAFNELFADDLSVADPIDLQFALYDVYTSVYLRHNPKGTPMSFDRFAFWGNMILDDFDDIDSQMADASVIYHNLRNFREIKSAYLTADQLDIIRQIWGKEAAERLGAFDPDDFWKHVQGIGTLCRDEQQIPGDGDDPEAVNRNARHFLQLWEILGEIYEEFRRRLDRQRLAYPGMAQRSVACCIRETDASQLPFARVAFVGFNVASTSLAKIMLRFKNLGIADFFWDIPADMPYNHDATRTIRALCKVFPMPDGFEPPQTGTPRIEVIGTPSNFLQTKAAAALLRSRNDADDRKFSFDNTVVLLPDTSLLPALISSLPAELDKVNVTMGLSYRDTPFASLMRAIATMHIKSSVARGRISFLAPDVRDLVAQPHLRSLFPEGCALIDAKILSTNRFSIPADDIAALISGSPMKAIFATVADTSDPRQVLDYFNGVIDALRTAIDATRDPAPDAPEPYEAVMLEIYASAAVRILGNVERYGITNIGEHSVFGLLERVLATGSQNISGQPVSGIQIMGMLETRALDFDRVIVLSMNEGIFPRRTRLRTFIPQFLRRGFGLPTSEDVDNEYAYYFFRLLSRCSDVCCLYDTRTSGTTGTLSRYIMQIDCLGDASNPITFSRYGTQVSPAPGRVITVAKTPEVMAEVNRYKDPVNGRNLSATALKTYRSCGLAFYLNYVRGLKEDHEAAGYMDAATYGSILHAVLEDLYNEQRLSPSDRPVIDKAAITRMRGQKDSLRDRVFRKIDELYLRSSSPHGTSPARESIPAESRLVGDLMTLYIEKVLDKEEEYIVHNGPYTFAGAEERFATVKGHHIAPDDKSVVTGLQWKVSADSTVNFELSIDRHDILSDGSHRFVDYKTGSDSPVAASVDALFSPDHSEGNDAILQLLIYANAYADLTGRTITVTPALYRLRHALSLKTAGNVQPFTDDSVSFDSGQIRWSNDPANAPEWAADFRRALEDMIDSIFNEDVPFAQTEHPDNCRYCTFRELCNR